MSRALALLALLGASAVFAAPAQKPSPREAFQAAVDGVQASPTDGALREKVIALARKLKPAPAPSAEARRRMIRGATAMKGASSAADFRAAAAEFEKALLEAPWWGDAYHNLAIAKDQAEDFAGALAALRLARLASPGNQDAVDLATAVEFRMEKAASPEARAAKQAKLDEALVKSLDGAVFTHPTFPGRVEFQFRVEGGRLRRWQRRLSGGSGYCLCEEDVPCSGSVGHELACAFSVALTGRQAENTEGLGKGIWTIAEDGRSLSETIIYNGNAGTPTVYARR